MTKICSNCGKEFILPANNLYKLSVKGKSLQFCSYTCYRVVQKKKERTTKSRRRLV